MGLSEGGEAVAELVWRSERNHSVELVPAIRRLMGHAGVEMGDLEAVFVALGPGAFSALRVGISTAKAMAIALDVPLVSVGTLDIEAGPYLGLGTRVCAVIEAGRDRAYLGIFEPDPEEPSQYQVVSHGELVSAIGPDALLCGEGVRAVADAVGHELGREVQLAEAAPPTRRPAVLARLAYRRWRSEGSDDPATLQPTYLRSAQVDTAHRTWAVAKSREENPL